MESLLEFLSTPQPSPESTSLRPSLAAAVAAAEAEAIVIKSDNEDDPLETAKEIAAAVDRALQEHAVESYCHKKVFLIFY